jgi:hypothetical protein
LEEKENMIRSQRGVESKAWDRLASLLMALICSNSTIFGQSEAGGINGTVIDPNGAIVVGAEVSIKALNVGGARAAKTDERGFYSVAGLQPYLYEVTATAPGFALRIHRIKVNAGMITTVNIGLTVTPVKLEEAVIGGGGVEVNIQNQELSVLISARQLQEFPTISRNPYDLVSLAGNVTPIESRNGLNNHGFSGSRGVSYSINGQPATSNNLRIDGGELPDSYQTEFAQQTPLDSVQEILVLTNNYAPEYGRATGGIISLVTRQGSNEFHGSAYSFHGNDALSTNSYDNNANGTEQGHLLRNQFGYSAGGAIRRNRLYFFNSAEGNMTRSREDQIALVAAPELLAASSFQTQQFFNAARIDAPRNGRVFTVDQIHKLLGQDPSSGGAFSLLPAGLPAFEEARYGGMIDAGAGLPQDALLALGRIDYHLNERSQLYGRYAYEYRDLYSGTFSSSPYRGVNSGAGELNHSAMIHWSNAPSPNWAYTTKVAFSRFNVSRQLSAQPASPRLIAVSAGHPKIGGYSLVFPGYLPFEPDVVLPFSGPQNLLHFNQDLNAIFSSQQFRFGGSYFYLQDNRTIGAYQDTVLTLGPSLPQALSNLVTGQVTAFEAAINPQSALPGQTIQLPIAPASFGRSASVRQFAFYFNDNWRASRRLTVNAGLRYDYFGSPRSRDGRIHSDFIFGTGADIFEQIRNGTIDSPASDLYQQAWGNFGPRLGFAWDVLGTGKISLRGGYGLSYQGLQGSPSLSVLLNPPNIGVIDFAADAGAIALSTDVFGPLSARGETAALPPLSLRAVASNSRLKTAHSHFSSLSLEYELAPNTVASVGYAGSFGRDLYGISNINRPGSGAVYLGDLDPAARLNPRFASIYWITNDGRSNYNALLAEVSNSSWRTLGLTFTGRYRFARAMDNLGSFPSHNLNQGFTDPFNPALDYGPSDFDIRHRFTSSFSWEAPFDKFTRGAVRRILGGWQLAGIWDYHSGAPYTVFNCVNAGSAESSCPRIQLTGAVASEGANNPRSDPTIPNRFVFADLKPGSAGSFVNPITGSSDFGPYPSNMLGRNFFRGPGFWNIDIGVYKRFQFREGVELQFRAEFYNVFNHANYFAGTNPVDINSTNYVSAAKDGRRNIRLAIKLTF